MPHVEALELALHSLLMSLKQASGLKRVKIWAENVCFCWVGKKLHTCYIEKSISSISFYWTISSKFDFSGPALSVF